ncbi:pyridoxamine 5'-phosphate oxidase family protein [Gynuella sp.]|uniref:pyridoxamine 5'-phosphate oxidase family protein n=1 Tax=Gynuella sp. TaxID=2969146 RepID=UPI003D148579
MTDAFTITSRNQVKRGSKKADYRKEAVYRLIDKLKTGHVAFVEDNEPRSLPLTIWRIGDDLYCHSANKGRFSNALISGQLLCISFAINNQWVMSKSAYHHSANYESAILFCTGERLSAEEDFHRVFKAVINQIEPDRWDQIRPPSAKEMKATTLIKLTIQSASFKSRTGGPNEEPEDMEIPVWHGVLDA